MHQSDPRQDPKRRFTARGPWLAASAVLLAVSAAPFAFAAGEGKPIDLSKRNPRSGAASKETQVIARTPINSYGTRQSNLGAGGGAIYGCRATLGADPANPKQTTPCVRINNLVGGEAFQFASTSGPIIGVIQSGPAFGTAAPKVRPFITNATDVATGLNADRLDGRDAEQIIAEARQSNPASAAPSFAFARVLPNATVDQSRTQGVTNANIRQSKPGVYCFYGLSSRPKNAQVTLDGVPGEVSSDVTSNSSPDCPDPNVEIIVRTYSSAGAAENKGFQIALTGGGA